METFSGRAGLCKGITPNNRTGVKISGTGLPCRRNEGKAREVKLAHLSSF